jgi:hypothetical protein
VTLVTELIQEVDDRVRLADVDVRLAIEIAARRDCQDRKTACRPWWGFRMPSVDGLRIGDRNSLNHG